MKRAIFAALLLAACASPAPIADADFVDILSVAPDIVVDIRYATSDNFTKTVLYPVNRCLLRRSVAKKLAQVRTDLKGRKLGLKVWDCYRPLSIQRRLWKLVPDPRYVADPKKGSRHNRGAAVDLTLVDSSGRELAMPTGYDDFSKKAHRDYAGATDEQKRGRKILEEAMKARGFSGLSTEWWHFDAEGWRAFPVTNVSLESLR